MSFLFRFGTEVNTPREITSRSIFANQSSTRFSAVPLGSPRRQRQHRILGIKRLNRRLLVHAEHRRMLRWVEIQINHVGGLGLEIRIVRRDVVLESMRLQAVLGSDTRHRHVRDVTAQFSRQLARGPVGRAFGRLALGRPRRNACLQPIRDLVPLAPRMRRKQPGTGH